jgi:hypothetical protein
MQDALSDFEPTIGNAKDILVLRALVMHTHLVRPQHHQCQLAGCVGPAPRAPGRAASRVATAGEAEPLQAAVRLPGRAPRLASRPIAGL